MKFKLILTFILSSAFMVNAQNDIFKVLAAKNVVLKSNDKWINIIGGDKLYENSTIQLKEGGYIGLMHKSGKPVEIKQKGIYNTSELAAKINTKTTGYAQKYATFAMNKMTTKASQESADVTGGVDRAINVSALNLKLFAPDRGRLKIIKNKPVMLTWKDTMHAEPYLVSIINMYDEKIYTGESTVNSLTVDLSTIPLNNNEIYMFQVCSKHDTTTTSSCPFSIMEDEEAASIEKELQELAGELNDLSPLDNLIYASFYEEKGLLLDALKYYDNAVKTGNGIEEYKTAYDNFLERNGMGDLK